MVYIYIEYVFSYVQVLFFFTESTCNFTYLLEYRILQVRFSTVLVNICGDFLLFLLLLLFLNINLHRFMLNLFRILFLRS